VAVAVLPALSLVGFTHGLEQRLSISPIPVAVSNELLAERAEQGALSPPDSLSAEESEYAEAAIRGAFADGFRLVMLVCAGLLFAGALISFVELKPTARLPGAVAGTERSVGPPPP
jgi:hypothetical protein